MHEHTTRRARIAWALWVLSGPLAAAAQTFEITPALRGLRGEATETAGVVYGVHGVCDSSHPGSAGALGDNRATSGEVYGVVGITASSAPNAAGGLFESAAGVFAGPILRGVAAGQTVFRVSATGVVTASALFGDGTGLGALGDLNCDACINPALHLAPHAVGAAELAEGSVGGRELASASVGGTDIAVGAVTTEHLFDGAVTSAKIADGSVQGTDIALSAVRSEHLPGNAVTTAKLADDTIRRSDIAGVEVAVWEINEHCAGAHQLSERTTCASRDCGGGLYLDCAGVCFLPSPAFCTNELYGYLVNP